MPNWVITRIYITGPEDKIKEFEDKVIDMSEDAEKAFSFQKISPTPAELVNTTSPSPQPKKMKVKTQSGEELEIEEISDCNNATPEMCEELILKYGRSNWYDWQCFNWGTKWDASESVYSQEDKMLEFQTAWSCPSEVIQKMADKFPDLKFTGTFADEDFGSNTGYIEDGGTFHLENGSEEAYETAATLWNYQGYYDDERGKWIHEGEEDE
jgi:hypothetical protein